MKIPNFHSFPRDIEAGDILENFLIASVASILIIRVFLYFTGYPQIGGEGLHIAHMLWGGFLMFLSLLILFVFINKEVKYIAATVGGIGFGTFIDELGKFLTQDNNYFFQPAIAIIYVILVLIFLGGRAIERYFNLSKDEYAINALEMTKQVLMHDLDKEEKEKAIKLLKKSDPENPIVKALLEALDKTVAISVAPPTMFHKLRGIAHKNYLKIIASSRFIWIVINIFIIASVINFFQTFSDFKFANTFAEWGQLIFSFISGLFVLIGIYILKYMRSRRKAYETFRLAVLISIFLTQFFLFLQEQLSAITGLMVSILIYSVLQYSISQENLIERKQS